MTEIYTSVLVSGTRRLMAGSSMAVNKVLSKETVEEKSSDKPVQGNSQPASNEGKRKIVPDDQNKQSPSSALLDDLLQAQEKTISDLKSTISQQNKSRKELELELDRAKKQLVAYEAKEKNYGSHESMAAAMDALLADTRRTQQEFKDAAEVYNSWSQTKAVEIERVACQLTAICLRKFVSQEIGNDKYLLDIIAKVVADIGVKDQIVLRVAPRDLSLVENCKEQLVDELELSRVSVIADSKVQMGGCFIDTPNGSWDGRLETQLARIEQALLDSAVQDHSGAAVDEVPDGT